MTPNLGKTKSIAEVGLQEYRWTPLQIYSRRSDNRSLFCQNPQEGIFRGACEKALLEGLLTVYPNRILGFSEYCASPRLSQRYPPIARYRVWCLNMPIGCDTPFSFSERFPLEEHASGGAIPPLPPQKGISAILAQYPLKTRHNA